MNSLSGEQTCRGWSRDEFIALLGLERHQHRFTQDIDHDGCESPPGADDPYQRQDLSVALALGYTPNSPPREPVVKNFLLSYGSTVRFSVEARAHRLRAQHGHGAGECRT